MYVVNLLCIFKYIKYKTWSQGFLIRQQIINNMKRNEKVTILFSPWLGFFFKKKIFFKNNGWKWERILDSRNMSYISCRSLLQRPLLSFSLFLSRAGSKRFFKDKKIRFNRYNLICINMAEKRENLIYSNLKKYRE